MGTRFTFLPVAFWTNSTPGPSLTTTFCGFAPSILRFSCLNLVINSVCLRIVVLFTITVEGLTGSLKRRASTKTNADGTTVTPRGGQSAQPRKSPPTRQQTQAL